MAALSVFVAVPDQIVPASPTASAAAARPVPAAPPSYYRPVIVDGMTFPVARSNWLSVIRFEEDWHEPRMRLIDGKWHLVGFHEGNDISAEKGTPVLSVTPGTVEAVGWTFYSGTRVGVRGSDGRYYFYAHLSSTAVTVGAPVQAGTVLGRVGNTGYGPPGHEDEFPAHLHFGIQEGAGWVNPYPLVARLYRHSVRATRRVEQELAQLAAKGRRKAHDRLAAQLYADLA